MATGTTKIYGNLPMKLGNKEIDLDTDDIKIMLCTSSYVPNQDTHIYKSSITNEVANGNGYTTGGISLANKALSYDAGTNVTKFDADDVSWTTSTITARYAVIYDNTPATDAEKSLIAYIDFGTDQSSSNGTFSIAFNTSGIFGVTVSV